MYRADVALAGRRRSGLRWFVRRSCVAAIIVVLAGCAANSPVDERAEPDQPAPTIVATPSPETTPTADAAAPAVEQPTPTAPAAPSAPSALATRTGAGALVDEDLALLHDQRVGLIAHRASVVDGRPLAVLIDEHPQIELTALFAPEHGLYGEADAGAVVSDVVDPVTGAAVFSLYGDERAPTPSALADVDVLVYDLQDVGVRFYTYTSTLGLAMQAAASADVEFVVLDRPNPIGGDHLQGPTLASGLESFIGLYNLPSAYGLTAGELAMLIQREQLMPGLENLDMRIVPVRRWTRAMRWIDTGLEWVPPSPNLPTADAALVYPGTVLFEATSISEGRGTDEPFTLIGASWIDAGALADDLNRREIGGVRFVATSFTPRSIPGAAESPRFQGEQLAGVRIQITDPHRVAGVEVGLEVLDAALRQAETAGLEASTIITRPDVFDRLAGTSSVRTDLIAGRNVADILASFVADHDAFAEIAASSQIYD